MEKGTVRWQYPQNDSRFWWNSLHVESDCVIASEGARVLLLDRTNGRVRWSLQVRKKPGRFRVRVAVTPRRVLIGADRAGRARGVLVEVDRKTNVTRQTFQSPKGCELLVVHAEKAICREGDRLVARNVSKLDQVVWANRQMPWFDPGKRGVLYQHFLLTRTSALPVFDLRDGTSFLLFHHPRGRELHVPNLPVGVHKGKLLTADSRGILAWDLRRLAQRGSAEQGKWIWKARNSKLPARGGPYLAACLLVGDRLYLSVTLSRSPVF